MTPSTIFCCAAVVFSLVALPVGTPVRAHHDENHNRPSEVRGAGLDQRLNEQVPGHLAFRDERGRPVALVDYFGREPILLVLGYFNCPHLCPLVSEGLMRSLRALPFRMGEDFRVLTVSIDPRDTPEQAREKKREIPQDEDPAASARGWHFLTGEKDSVEALARAVGFRYSFNDEEDRYAHAAGLMVLTPGGRISRYFYGIEYSPRDLRLGLVEASAGKIGSAVDQLLLFCYHYDPAAGKYSLVVMNVMRLAGLGTALALGGFMLAMFGRERRDTRSSRGTG